MFRSFALSLVVLAACSPQPVVTAAEVQLRYESGSTAYERAFAEFERTAAPGQAYQGDLAPLADYLRAAMRQRRDASARARAAVYLANLPSYSLALTADDFAEIATAAPAASPEWQATAQNSIRFVAEGLVPAAAREFLEALAEQNSEAVVRGWAIIRLAELERREGREQAFREAYARLAAYGEVDDLRFPIRLLNPENLVTPGKPAPAFVLEELGTGRMVRSESLRGRYYLLDFWATWCGPCVMERANITRAQERFGGDRFTVVSISIDNSPEDAIQFRQRRWPTNWLNLYAPGSHYSDEDFALGGDVAQAYEITWIGVPQLVLVSPEGQVLALRDQLDGPMLERTLSRYLGAPN